MPDFEAILRDAIASRVFPGAAVEIGRQDGARRHVTVGTLTYEPRTADVTSETIYDLASLTKVIATTTLVMRAVDERRLDLDAPLSRWMPECRGVDRESVTIRDVLAHAAGFTAYLPFFRDHTGRREFEHAICTLPLEYPPRTKSIYSDLGFILLGFILEDIAPSSSSFTGADGAFDPARSLAVQFQRVASFITREPLTFRPPRAWRDRIAPTEFDPWRGRLLVGEVHDENTWALGGVAGHSGLFGTASAVGAFARAVLRTIRGERILADPATMHAFLKRTDVPGSSRALGWDTMLPTSSCGTLMSPTAIGHTGFTGTSLWIDWERDMYVVLLTNRVHPSRENNEPIRRVRRSFHDAVMVEIARG